MFLTRTFKAGLATIMLFVATFGALGAEELKLYDWKSHTSMMRPFGAEYDPITHSYWAATEGGAYQFFPSTKEIKLYRNDSSLSALAYKSIKFNASDSSIYLGSLDGALDIIHQDGSIDHVNDIRASEQFTDRSINSIVFRDDVAYLGCGFGIAALNTSEKVFVETITKIGSATQFEPVKKLLIAGDNIWALMNGAAAYADLTSFLANPNSWKILPLPEGNAIDMAEASGKIYFAIDTAIYELRDTIVEKVFVTWFNITNLQSRNGELYWAIPWEVNKLGAGVEYLDYKKFMNGFALTDGGFISYTRNSGLIIINGTDTLRVIPKTPAGNEFYDMDVSPEGELWATGSKSANWGVSRLTGDEWRYYTSDNSAMPTASYFKVSTGARKVALSGWGGGFVLAEPDSDTLKLAAYNELNSPMTLIKGMAIAGESEYDSRGTLWVVNYGETSSGPMLVAMDTTGAFYSFTNCREPSNRWILPLAIDNYGTKWVGSTTGAGIFYYNENGTLSDKSDDECGVLTTYTSNALASDEISSLTLDKTGSLWIGTPKGLTQFLNPQTVLSSKPSFFMRSIKFLNGEAINDIYVDATNNKWIASNKGVWALSPEGDSLTHIDKTNSPLPTDQILSITGNPATGQIFFGTLEGLFEAKSLFAAPLTEFDIKVFPQPFTPQKHGDMLIEGLAENSEIRILTVSGDFVRSINASGRRAIWDGRDSRGFDVPTGVYIIIATSSTNKSGAQKVAVTREKQN